MTTHVQCMLASGGAWECGLCTVIQGNWSRRPRPGSIKLPMAATHTHPAMMISPIQAERRRCTACAPTRLEGLGDWACADCSMLARTSSPVASRTLLCAPMLVAQQKSLRDAQVGGAAGALACAARASATSFERAVRWRIVYVAMRPIALFVPPMVYLAEFL